MSATERDSAGASYSSSLCLPHDEIDDARLVCCRERIAAVVLVGESASQFSRHRMIQCWRFQKFEFHKGNRDDFSSCERSAPIPRA